MPSLPEVICQLRREGKLPVPFGTEDIRKLLQGRFSKHYINTVLANYTEGTGDYVLRGQRAWFRRVRRGKYDVL